MDILRKVFIKILLFVTLSGFVVSMSHVVLELVVLAQGMAQLKQDAYILGSILEEENCLSIDLGGASRYKSYVDTVLRATETDVFKYNIQVSGTGNVTNNTSLGGDEWSGVDDVNSPIRISKEYTSYVTCPQRGGTVSAELTMTVYTPTLMEIFIAKDDNFAKSNRRMKREITQEIKVMGMKYYKGKESK